MKGLLTGKTAAVFFSLDGRLPRDQWRLAMTVAIAVFFLGVSLLHESEQPSSAKRPAGTAWMLAAWSLTFVCAATLLCAKRLLDARRRLWLALPIPVAGIALIWLFALNAGQAPMPLKALVAYLALCTLPALICCAFYESEH